MSDLISLTIAQALSGLSTKKFSSLELTNSHLAQMKKHRNLNAYVLETPAIARKQAAESDTRIAIGEARKLDGIPIGVKYLYCTKDVRTTSCSKILSNFIPSYESTVSSKVAAHGTIMLGKTNMD